MGHIPAILHHAWFGPKPMPPAYSDYIAGWRRLSSGWTVMGWTERDLDWSSRYVNEAYATRGWTRLADYMRVHALHRFGGFYLDTDMELIRRLDPLRDARVVLGFQSRGRTPSWVNNAVIGAAPGHPFLGRWLQAFEDRMPWMPRPPMRHGRWARSRCCRPTASTPIPGPATTHPAASRPTPSPCIIGGAERAATAC
jgi:mannosyltransferase OCH1-like enzyme